MIFLTGTSTVALLLAASMIVNIKLSSITFPKVSLAAIAMFSSVKSIPKVFDQVFRNRHIQQVITKATIKKNTR